MILAALHARLLWQRVEDLSITDPAVIGRWCAAAAHDRSEVPMRSVILILTMILVYAAFSNATFFRPEPGRTANISYRVTF
ncbi:MAG: hypothetical protein ABI779_01540 [Acidobacteriota bacterium]